MPDRRHGYLAYDPYDPRNYDSGGFGYGGTSGSAGGFGVGGEGPQTGGYGSQANYGQGYPAGDYGARGDRDYFPEAEEEPRMSWLDSFPHTLHGWGPLTPDYGPNPQSDLGYTPRTDRVPQQDYGRDRHRNYAREAERDSSSHPDDEHYRALRARHMRSLDDDYTAWREERQARFHDDFHDWRSRRENRSQRAAEAEDTAEPDFDKTR